MKLHSGRGGSITWRGVWTPTRPLPLALSAALSCNSHCNSQEGGDVEVEEFIHIQLQQRGNQLCSRFCFFNVTSLGTPEPNYPTWPPFFFFFADVYLRSKKNMYLDIISEEMNVHFQKPAGTGGSKANWMQRCCVITANPSLRDWTPAFVLFRYKDPYPPPPL